MAKEEKRPSGRKSFGDKSFGGRSKTTASARSNSGTKTSFGKFSQASESSYRPKKSTSNQPKSYRGANDLKKSFGSTPSGDDRPKRPFGNKVQGGFDARPKRDNTFNKLGSGEPKKRFGDKPSFGRKSFGGNSSFGDKPKRSFGDFENEGNETKRSFGRKPFGESDSRNKGEGGYRKDGDSRPRFGEKKTFGDKPSFNKKTFSNKPKGGFGEENEGGIENRSFGRKPFGEKSYDQFKSKKTFGSRVTPDEDVEKRKFERKSFDSSSEERPKKTFSKDAKPRFGDKKPFGDKPKGGFGFKKNFGVESKPKTGFEDFKFDKKKNSDEDFIASDFEKAAKYVDEAPKKEPKKPSKPLFTESVSDSKEGIRLNKYIANSGICSRREADVLISQGLVTVNGKPVTELGVIVKRNDIVKFDGRTLNPEKNVYLLLNKPKDFITTTNDPQERKTVMNLVANACKERIYPVGRLDRNTTGLLLFTNDGELAEKLTHPSNGVKKIYQVEVDRPISPEDAQLMLDGLYFEEGRATLDSMAILDESRKTIGVELHIGWNRIVRRIFEAKGYEVVRLDRVLYAGLTKKDLPRGEWRFLTEKEVIALKYPQRA